MNSVSPLVIASLLAIRSRDFRLHIDSLQLTAGSITCIAGPNGSGKTTLIECVIGLLWPQKGEVRVFGHPITNDLRATKSLIGYIPDDEEWFIKELSAQEYLEVLTHVYQEAGVTADIHDNIYRIAEQLHFTQFTSPLDQLSHGNKKKVQIIAGLMHEPGLIVIDELRNGLDPLAIIAAERLITAQARRGACILAATHDVWWAERVAKKVLLLVDGKVALHDSTATIKKKYGSIESLFVSLDGMSK
ncbi:MAG TPA: ABC transporter ATP-binding protein [Candidatus Saccharimonadales bacterium]